MYIYDIFRIQNAGLNCKMYCRLTLTLILRCWKCLKILKTSFIVTQPGQVHCKKCVPSQQQHLSKVYHHVKLDLSVGVCFEGDLNCIAGATSRNGAFIWDVRKGKIITRFNEVTLTISANSLLH